MTDHFVPVNSPDTFGSPHVGETMTVLPLIDAAPAPSPSRPRPAVQRLRDSVIKEVVVTNTVALPPEKQFDRLTIISVAGILGEAIQRIHAGASVSAVYRAAGPYQARMSLNLLAANASDDGLG